MGVDTMRNIGTMLGTCCAIVMDETTCMVRAAQNLMIFYAHESCGQCTPCREGCAWMAQICNRLEDGTAHPTDLDLLLDVANNIMGNTICALGDGAAMPMLGFLQKYRAEFEAHLRTGKCPSGRRWH
jgi:NADH-quinone oxidoreductase subunit F